MGDRIVVMDHGIIAQTGTPMEIYSHPKTPFVADFIGKMNFVEGVVSGVNEVTCHGLRFTTALSDEPFSTDDHIFLCIRPEDIVLLDGSDDRTDDNQIETFVRDSEFLGAVFRIRLAFKSASKTEFIAEIPPANMRALKIQTGDAVQVQFPADRLHIYRK